MIKNRTLLKVFALHLALQILAQTILPTVSYALTSGPTQPEFSSFEPVSSSNMVDDFSGDFTYTLPVLEVPGPHGGSYPLTLSYHSGATPEEEASWVGFGWTLNPGAINRNMRGIPDDFKNDNITFFNKAKRNYTVTAGWGASITPEIFSFDKQFFSPGINASYRYNNYRGFSRLQGVGLALGRGVFNLGYTVSEGEGSFSLNINPGALLSYAKKQGEDQSKFKKDLMGLAKQSTKFLNYGTGSTYGIFTYNQAVLPTQVSEYSGNSFNVSAAINIDPSGLPIGVGGNVVGSYTYQDNKPVSSAPGFGSLYSSSATTDGIMDYHVDRENPYDKQDLFLGTPFNDADNFIVTGEGIGGGFRLYNSNIGHFGQRHVSSNLTFYNTSVEFEVGQNFGAGGDIGIGKYKMQAEDWKKDLSTFNDPNSATLDEPVFFRFNNDLGGSLGDNMDDKPVRFGIRKEANDAVLEAPVSFDYRQNTNGRNKRSSYINFRTNAQINTTPYKAYSRRSDINAMARRSENADRIGELAVINEDGVKYIYALPVYSKEENNLSFGLKGVTPSQIEKNFVSYNWNEEETKVGQSRPGQYAYSYLLTEIQTADYLDISAVTNGPTPDDLGGYVRFGYDKVYGSGGDKANWYRWRTPYNGASYQRNQLSEATDDIATVVSGQKEIYYIKTIETKTHLAVFKCTDRTDGLGALADNAAKVKGAKSTDALKRLDQIDLYPLTSLPANPSRDSEGNIIVPAGIKPLKTVHFKYYESTEVDKQLMKGAPNASGGRLTLKKVYFEYNGISQVRINPYIFKYQYPSSSNTADPVVYPSKYSAIADFGSTVKSKPYWNDNTKFCNTNVDPENPPYSEFSVDAWGNYQPFGCNQYDSMRTWINQRWKPNVDFDPAPWHLKRIVLPSGGEIHVQYEQDDYQYVQDQNAHVMVRLKAESGLSSDSRFYIDIRDLGISWSDPDIATKVNALRDLITDRYIGAGKSKMYFKFLFQLFANPSMPDQKTCNAEYINGYGRIINAVADLATKRFYIDMESNNIPKSKCHEYVFANVVGRVNTGNICDRSAEPVPDKGGAAAMVMAFLTAGDALKGQAVKSNYCNKINESLSYLRLPAVVAKKGGGLRVKRLLIFDDGIDGRVLYGNEYSYTTEENGRVISSGVATYEPASSREENILIGDIAKKDQSWDNKLIVGKDKEQYEGPPGESIYPGPSVGYAKVTVANIHSGKTNPGFTLNEFWTAKDYPIKWYKTDINHRSKPKVRFALIANEFVNNHWASQGYSFVLNNMHGQYKRIASYSYSGTYENGIDFRKATAVSEKIIEYYQPGELVPVMSKLYGTITNKPLGRESDITLAQKAVSETSWDGNIEMDFTVGVFGILPIPFLGAMPSFSRNEAVIKTHVMTKVVRYPALVKRSTSVQDGIYHIDENVAFDELTGKPVATKSYDEFKGAYMTQQVPAGWEYANFTQKASTENKLFIADATVNFNLQLVDPGGVRAKLIFGGANGCERLSELVTGDLLEFNNGNLYHVESVNYASDHALLIKAKSNPAPTAALTTGATTKFLILTSGRNNQLNQQGGNIVFHHEDKNAITPASFAIPPDQRYDASHNFVTDLNVKMSTTPKPAEFTLAGPYTQMNMSAYQDRSPCCAADWANASVTNVKFRVVDNGTETALYLIEFDIDCGTTACGMQNVKIKND